MEDDHASPEDYGDHASDTESIQDDLEIKAESSHTSPSATSGKNVSTGKSAVHLQKRRRVTRACDECRRKKIKCDGKQPCTHCTVYSYECTYDQPSNRRRNPAPQYVENLEHRVHRAETLLHILIPNLDLNDPGIDAAVAQGWIPGAPGKGGPAPLADARQARPPPVPINGIKSDANLESMVRAVAQIDLDETGHWDYHGHSSGLSFFRRMREQLGDLMGPETVSSPFIKSRAMSQVLDSPRSSGDSPLNDLSPNGAELPPRDTAMQLCGIAMNDAAALLRVVHQPTFWQNVERIYSTPPDHFGNEENRFLPLFYSIMALGSLFSKDEQGGVVQEGYETGIQQGFTYFRMARYMMDITDCRDLWSIQAVVYMIMFLQSSAKLSQCYAYVGVAMRAALRMGLHRSAAGKFDPIEQEMRKRTFWAVRKLDIYVGTMLGLPLTLHDEDIDQEFPIEVDDEYITLEGIRPMPEGTVSLMTAFSAHTRLVNILAKIVRLVYPIKAQNAPSNGDRTYSVAISVIREIENDLEQWKNSLPPILSPCDAPARYTRIQQLLRLSYAHAQVMLYRPFLHFTAMDKRSKPVDQRAYACAASFVNVSRNIIHITIQMKQKSLLNGAHWFIMYTTFFSVLALVYFAAENPDNATTEAVMKDAIDGKEVLASLAKRSLAADRCTATLDVVFQRLPQWMRDGQQNPATRKRPYQSEMQRQPGDSAAPLASQSHPDISAVQRDPKQATKRASTFPDLNAAASVGSPSPFSSTWSHSSSTYGPNTPSTAALDPHGFGGLKQKTPATPGNGGMQTYGMPPNFANPALMDLSSMMFPTADEPFIYPNQPLTTFENNQQFTNPNAFVNNQTFPNVEEPLGPGHTPLRGRDENIEAQFYALPPYIEQRQSNQSVPRHNVAFQQTMPLNGEQQTSTTVPPGMPMVNGNWAGQRPFQQDMSNINIHDIFGGAEWNPMVMHTGYQQ